jgi:hypothetical protein
MKIANIVSNTKENVSDDFNVVKSLDDIIQGLPTLIIGWEYIKNNYPNYSIIDRKLDNNLFWTFKKTENRELHDEDIYNFSLNVYKNLIKNVKYYFLDFISLKKSNVKKFLYIFYNNKSITYRHQQLIKNIDMAYIYMDNVIYGIDLNLLEYIGFNKNKILDRISKNTKVFLEQNNIFIEYKKGIDFLDNQVKYIPYLYTIKNG